MVQNNNGGKREGQPDPDEEAAAARRLDEQDRYAALGDWVAASGIGPDPKGKLIESEAMDDDAKGDPKEGRIAEELRRSEAEHRKDADGNNEDGGGEKPDGTPTS